MLVLLLLIATSALYLKVGSLDAALLGATGRVRTHYGMVKEQQAMAQRFNRLERSSTHIQARVKRLEFHKTNRAKA